MMQIIYIHEDGEASVKSISINGNTLTFKYDGRSIIGKTHTSTFYIFTNNGVNGSQVRSNTITLSVY